MQNIPPPPTGVLAILPVGARIGAALYTPDDNDIVLGQAHDDPDCTFLAALLLQTRPSTVLLLASASDPVRAAIANALPAAAVESVRKQDFDYDLALRYLQLVHLPDMPPTATAVQRLSFLYSIVNIEEREQLRAFGALIAALIKLGLVNQLDDDDAPIHLDAFCVLSLRNTLSLDTSAYYSLQIFSDDRHPSGHAGRTKEGLSVFGIFNHTKSVAGRRLLKEWFLRPPLSIETIETRHDAIAFFTSGLCAHELGDEFREQLRLVGDAARILRRVRLSSMTAGDWNQLCQTSIACYRIRELARLLPPDMEIARRIIDAFGDVLFEIADLINSTVDFDESRGARRFVVKPGVHPDLDRVKVSYEELDQKLTRIAHEIMGSTASDAITQLNVTYFPQLGYLVVIPRAPGIEEALPESFSLEFGTAENLYLRCPQTLKLDEDLGDVYSVIIDMEQSIMRRVQADVLAHGPELVQAVRIAAELDCLITMALVAREHRLVRPVLTPDCVLHVRGGRHLLQELCVDQFIANDTAMLSGQGGLQLITGPNGSGKSCYVRQVGLIVFLAHMGAFVPAESAVVGLTDRIFGRLSSRDTCTLALSTFQIDIAQIALMLRNATPRSVLLIDEFGKGTLQADGVALLGAVLRSLLRRGADLPRVFVATHMTEVLALLDHGVAPGTFSAHRALQMSNMEMMLEEEVVHLFRLIDGTATRSFGLECARRAGFPADVLDRADEALRCIQADKPIPVAYGPGYQERLANFRRMIRRFQQFDIEHGDVEELVRELREE